jgi:hypothetical protein
MFAVYMTKLLSRADILKFRKMNMNTISQQECVGERI